MAIRILTASFAANETRDFPPGQYFRLLAGLGAMNLVTNGTPNPQLNCAGVAAGFACRASARWQYLRLTSLSAQTVSIMITDGELADYNPLAVLPGTAQDIVNGAANQVVVANQVVSFPGVPGWKSVTFQNQAGSPGVWLGGPTVAVGYGIYLAPGAAPYTIYTDKNLAVAVAANGTLNLTFLAL